MKQSQLVSIEMIKLHSNRDQTLGGSGGMLPKKIFKIKGPRLAKNTLPEISVWKKLDKNKSAHIALLLNLGAFKKLSAGFEGEAIASCPPLDTALTMTGPSGLNC